MLAIFAGEELQVAEEETSLLLPSPKLPVAVNCWVFVSCKDALEGETEIAKAIARRKELSAAGTYDQCKKNYCEEVLLSIECRNCEMFTA